MELRQGTLLQGGKYRIERTLGQGGFGVTYLGTQVDLDRRVAVKEFFMKDYCNRDADTSHVSVLSEGGRGLVENYKQKFLKEARTIAALDHRNIVRIYDIFEENGTAYYVMEYIAGGSLLGSVKSDALRSENDALRCIRQVADALRYLHERRVMHLDVKPGNIMLRPGGDAVLIDFGISKHYDRNDHETSNTPVGRSKGYAPLEQYQEGGVREFSPATDIYSLGATLYYLLTGHQPPEAQEVYEKGLPVLTAIMPPNVANAITQAMQPRRADRPQSIDDFLRLLDAPTQTDETIVDITVPLPVPDGRSQQPAPGKPGEKRGFLQLLRNFMERKRKLAAVILALLIVLEVGLIAYARGDYHAWQNPFFPHTTYCIVCLLLFVATFVCSLLFFKKKQTKWLAGFCHLPLLYLCYLLLFNSSYKVLSPGTGYTRRTVVSGPSGDTYEADRIAIKRFGKWGLCDSFGIIVLPYTLPYDEVYDFFSDNKYSLVRKNMLWGVIDREGNAIIPPQYENLNIGWLHDTGMVIAMHGGKWGAINAQNQVLIPFECDYIYSEGPNNFVANRNSKNALFDRQGHRLTDFIFDSIEYNEERGHFVVWKDGKCGAIDQNGKTVVPITHDVYFSSEF